MELDRVNAKGVSTPGEKSGTYHDETELEKSNVTLYMSCVVRFAYLRLQIFRLCRFVRIGWPVASPNLQQDMGIL